MRFDRKMRAAAQKIRNSKLEGRLSDDQLLIYVSATVEPELPDDLIRDVIAFYNTDPAGFLKELTRLEAESPPEPPASERTCGPLDLAGLKEIIADNNMGEYEKVLVKSIRLGHALKAGGKVLSEKFVTGSRFRGRPAMAPGIRWPEHAEQPMQFIGQVKLTDLPPRGGTGVLPIKGLLSFFCSSDPGCGGPDVGRILYAGDIGGLSIRETPEGVKEFSARRINILPNVVCLPPWESERFDTLGLDDDASEAYSDFWHQLNSEQKSEPVHMLLGYPDQLQGDIEYHANKAAGTSEDRWRLCLQIDTDGSIGTQWGDDGHIYYMLPEERPALEDFSRCCLVMECY